MTVQYQILSSPAEVSRDKPHERLCWARAKEEPGDLGFISETVFQCITLNELLPELPAGQQFPQQNSETGETPGRAWSIIQLNFKTAIPVIGLSGANQ